MKRILIALTLCLTLLTTTASAQGPDAQKLYTKLYCPLCGGVRLDACELTVCADMKSVIQQKLAAGENEQQITDYFRKQYGDQVLGYPPTEGIHWFAWALPIGVFILGAFGLWRMAIRWTRAPLVAAHNDQNPIPDEMSARIERELDA